MNNYLQNTPLWHLTVGEFQELIEITISRITPAEQPKVQDQKDKYCHSIAEFAELLRCSETTAQKIKNSGKIDKAVTQVGRKLIIDKQMALKLLNKEK